MALDVTDLTDVVTRTREASRRLVRELNIIKEKVGLAGIAYTHGHILLHVEAHGLLTVAELADLLRLDKSTTSRAVAAMIDSGYLKYRESKTDRRRKPVALTVRGRHVVERVHQVANAEVESALSMLTDDERETIVQGMQVYARALRRSRMRRRYRIRTIRKDDNEYVARIIRTVMTGFGLDRPGSSLNDDEVKAMYETYSRDRAAYFVVMEDERVVGGAGIGPLSGADETICELKKMYLLPEARGAGVGEQLLTMCLEAARNAGYRQCYLETIREMTAARALYEKHGFRKLTKPLGDTGHFACDSSYARDISPR